MLVGILFLFGCTKTDSGRENASAEAEEAAGEELSDNERVEFVMKNEKQDREQAEENEAAEAAGGSREDAAAEQRVITENSAALFFFYNDQPHLIPHDFSLGPLQDRFSLSSQERAIYKRFALFFAGLTSAVIDPSFLLPAERTELARLISATLPDQHPPQSYRMGKIAVREENKVRFNIRVESGIGRSEGEIYMEKLEDQWYISGIHVDLSVLSVQYEKEGSQWQPGEYKWLPGNRF
jgi:hypothetical protein